MKLITTASDPNHKGWLQFKRSLDHFGWDYHLIVHEYTNYNDKIIAFHKYLVEHRHELTNFVYADSYDSFVLAPQSELEAKFSQPDKIVYGLEKACWPYPEKTIYFPSSISPYRHINGGGFMGSVENFIRLYDTNPILESKAMNDQVWAQDNYINKLCDGLIGLDTDSKVFQCAAHSDSNDFEIIEEDGLRRVLNLHTGARPVIMHGNGKTGMEWIYDLLP